jgi:hypothetical protein
MRLTRPIKSILGAALLLAAGSAAAQYVWIDHNGRRNYSDQPPPPDVRVLQAPKGMEQVIASTARPAAASAAPAAGTTLAEREQDFQKRRKESAETAQKAQQDAAQAAERKRTCDAARRAKAELDSGVRLRSHTAADANEVMSDAERAAESARASKIIAACR